MKYKVDDEAVLRDDVGLIKLRGKSVRIESINNLTNQYRVTADEYNGIKYTFTDDHIDREKTAELKHYSNSLENIVAEKNNRERVDAIEPAHYRQGNIDRIEVWYQTYPFEGFRWAMKSHIDKYIHRYESKGGIEDLDKATYFIKRLKEKELDL